MPIAFKDVDEIGSELGSAAYLKVDSSSDGGCSHGALLVISARGEPLEFAYNRVRVPQPFLWREADLRRYVQRRLTASLLSVCTQQPRILLCLEDEVGVWLFGQDLQLEVPVARVTPAGPAARRIDPDTGEVLDEPRASAQTASADTGPRRSLSEEALSRPTATSAENLDKVVGRTSGAPPAQVAWQPAPPDDDSVERHLFEHLSTHGLLLEPFERAAVGLREVYGRLTRPSYQ